VEKDNLLILHLVNYLQGNTLKNFPVDLVLDAGKRAVKVDLVSPDLDEGKELDFVMEGQKCRFNVPELQVYDMIVVRLSS
jgi:hypothetical protein